MLRTIGGVAVATLACLVLLLPAWINGSPIYWYDSLAHLHGGSSALSATLGIETRFSEMERAVPPDDVRALSGGTAPAPAATAGPDDDYRISMARSPYYSVVLVFLSELAGPFAPVVAQALLLVACGFFLLRAIFRYSAIAPALYLLAAVSLSTAGVFCATLLPDVLAPLGILAVAVLFCFHDRLRAPDKAFWFVVLVFALVSHTSHIAIAALLIPVGVLSSVLRGEAGVGRPVLICLCALAIGFLSLQVFSRTVETVYGYKPRPFPMIAASLIVDGPGMAYLQASCPGNGYVYCDYLHTEARNIDEYLWSGDRTKGVYYFADPETRNRMSDQQFRFLIDVLKYDFGGQFRASFGRFLQQIRDNSLGHMAYDRRLRGTLSGELPDPDRQLMVESMAYSGQFPFTGLSFLSLTSSLLGLGGTVLLLVRAPRCGNMDTVPSTAVMVCFAVLLICGIIINAGITGVLSNPQGRYGARVLWLLLILFAVVYAWYRHRSIVAQSLSNKCALNT